MKRISEQTILRVTNLTIRRSETVILNDVSWKINRGEHWVVLGANGSGKTSLLSALTGYLMPTSGEVEVLGTIFGESDWRKLRKKIGIVSSSIRQMMADSEPALDTVASGKYAMIDFWGTPSKQDRTEATHILKQTGCTHLAERPWAVLSQGERQRILIGRALMAKPSLLILDEPCAGLDPVARDQFLQFVNSLAKNAKSPTLVLVTHHVEEIQPMFSHVLLLKEGFLLAAGKKKTVLNSANLSETFGAPVKLTKTKNEYHLSIPRQKRSLF